MATTGGLVYASVFFVIPIVLILLVAFLWDANLFALIALFTWMGLGVLFAPALQGESTG